MSSEAPQGAAEGVPSIISSDLEIVGDLKSDGEIQIDGTVKGDIKGHMLNRYRDVSFDIPYPDKPRQKCDLSIADDGDTLFVESKLLRILGDNGKPNDNMLMHILSPYPQHRSALTDCQKLRQSGFDGRKAVLIIGYEGAGWPLEPAIDAFEVIAACHGSLGPRSSALFSGLCHPVHTSGEVFIWELI